MTIQKRKYKRGTHVSLHILDCIIIYTCSCPHQTVEQITYQKAPDVPWQDSEKDQHQEEEGDPKTRR
jgi:hypothetical protein